MKTKLSVFTLFLIIFMISFVTRVSAQNLIPKVNKGQIKIDGLRDDWAGIGAIVEEVGLPSTGAFGGFDVKKLFLAYDENNLYFLITMDKGIDDYFAQRQSSGYIGDIYLNTDNNSETGCIDKIMFQYGNITGYDYRIWISTGSGYKDGKNFPFVSYNVLTPNEGRDDFSVADEIAKAESYKDGDKIQFSRNNVEFLIPLETLNVDRNIEVKSIFTEFANQFSKEGNTAFSFVIR